MRRPELCVATVDHSVPTLDRSLPIVDDLARLQIEALRRNAEEFGIEFFDIHSPHLGIVHVIGPEMGFTQPGMTIVCGDSHTSTHGAFGALAMGIGTSQVEHVLATQCMPRARPRSMEVRVRGELPDGVTAKDLVLGIIAQIGVGSGTGHVIKYTGEAVQALSMEGRMTVCNMSIEAGARAGMVAPDETTCEYLRGRPRAPQGEAFDAAVARWRELATDPGASFDTTVEVDGASLEPFVTWGTNPGMSIPVTGRVPGSDSAESADDREAIERALEYMDLKPGTPIQDVSVDRVFLGSCTNSWLEDLRAAASVLKGRKVHGSVHAMVVPGSGGCFPGEPSSLRDDYYVRRPRVGTSCCAGDGNPTMLTVWSAGFIFFPASPRANPPDNGMTGRTDGAAFTRARARREAGSTGRAAPGQDRRGVSRRDAGAIEEAAAADGMTPADWMCQTVRHALDAARKRAERAK